MDPRLRLARIVSLVLNPSLLAGLTLLAVTARKEAGWMPSVVVALVFGPGVPTAYTVGLRATGRVREVFIRDPRARRAPLFVAAASCLSGFALLGTLDAPSAARGAMLGMAFQAAVCAFIAPVFPASLHTSGAFAAASVLIWVFGAVACWMLPLAAAVGWSRAALAAHTRSQVLAGGALGAGLTLLGLALAR